MALFRLVASVLCSFFVASSCCADESFVAGNIGKAAIAHSLIMRDYNGLVQLGLTQTVARNATRYIKESVDKTRPDGSSENSFPSGHTARAFSAAWYIHHRYGWKHSWPYLAASTWVAQQRVEQKRHYAEDVIASAALTYGISRLFVSKDAPIIGIWYDDGLQVSIIKRF